MSFTDRLRALKATAAANRGRQVVHAIDIFAPTTARTVDLYYGICGKAIQTPETGSAGEQWMMYKRAPTMRPCPECLKLWEALSSDERKILNLGY